MTSTTGKRTKQRNILWEQIELAKFYQNIHSIQNLKLRADSLRQKTTGKEIVFELDVFVSKIQSNGTLKEKNLSLKKRVGKHVLCGLLRYYMGQADGPGGRLRRTKAYPDNRHISPPTATLARREKLIAIFVHNVYLGLCVKEKKSRV